MYKTISIEDRTDHTGKVFDSISDMLKYWGINRNVYYNRIKRGWSKEKALTKHIKKFTV